MSRPEAIERAQARSADALDDCDVVLTTYGTLRRDADALATDPATLALPAVDGEADPGVRRALGFGVDVVR